MTSDEARLELAVVFGHVDLADVIVASEKFDRVARALYVIGRK